MNFVDATKSYEDWLRTHVCVNEEDLGAKHKKMASTKAGLFVFLRATFYRWVQVWPEVCPDLASAPQVLGVGDLHLENFGTWRDREGRLVWGVNDLDEAYSLPYTLDLVRLAASAWLAVEQTHLRLERQEVCDAILTGYRLWMENGGRPFVLAERTPWLRSVAEKQLRDAASFWDDLCSCPDPEAPVPPQAVQFVEESLPESDLSYRLIARQAGLGSLGRPRFVALADWKGGMVVREVKAMAPSACVWASPGSPPREDTIITILSHAIRCPDEVVRCRPGWMVRRLAPDCIKIEIDALRESKYQRRFLGAMGRETANIHLGSSNRESVMMDLSRRTKKDRSWLSHAAAMMLEQLGRDRRTWKKKEQE